MKTPDVAADAGPLLIDVQEVARLLTVSPRTVWRWLSQGELPAPVRIGGSVRWRLGDVRRWIDGGCRRPLAARPRCGTTDKT